MGNYKGIVQVIVKTMTHKSAREGRDRDLTIPVYKAYYDS